MAFERLRARLVVSPESSLSEGGEPNSARFSNGVERLGSRAPRARLALSLASVLVLGALNACGGGENGGGGGGGGDGGSSGEPAPANDQYALTFGSTTFLAAHENGTIAAIEGGDVVLAALTSDGALFVARLGPAAELRWAKTYNDASNEHLPSHIVVEATRIVVVASSQSDEPFHVIALEPGSGAVLASREYTGGCTYPARARALSDGGLVVSCSGNSPRFLRLNAAYDVGWSKIGRAGGDVHVLADGFAFAGVSSSLTPVNPGQTGGPQVGTGAGVHVVSNDGVSRGWHFMGPGPGTHSIGGVRALPNGNLVVALGVDSTRSDSPAALSPLVLATFGPDGSPVTMTRADMRAVHSTDGEVPLQFGGALSMVALPNETWVGFVANSGRIGSDFRGSVVARFGVDGSAKDATLTGVQTAPTTGGASLAFTLVNGSITLARSSPGDTTCVSRPTIEMRAITPYLDEKSATDSELQEVEAVGSDRALTPADVTGTAATQCPAN